jgi:uncharacterized protein YggU (UPF0235/DUF167 family)
MTRDAVSGEIRIDVHAAPSGGEANEACCELIAKASAVPASAVSVVTGHKSRRKLITIECDAPEAVVRCLEGSGCDR